MQIYYKKVKKTVIIQKIKILQKRGKIIFQTLLNINTVITKLFSSYILYVINEICIMAFAYMRTFLIKRQFIEKIWLFLEIFIIIKFSFLQSTYYNIIFVTEYLASGTFRLEQRMSRFLYLSFFFFSFPFLLLFPPSGYRHATNGRFNEPEMTWHHHVGNLLSESVVQRPSPFFSCAAIWARSWLSFFPISLARRHHVVTDDVPLCCRFFCDGRLSRVTLVSPRPSERMLYASVLSLRVRYHYLSKGNNKKNPEYYINNILLMKNRWRDDAISQKRYFVHIRIL